MIDQLLEDPVTHGNNYRIPAITFNIKRIFKGMHCIIVASGFFRLCMMGLLFMAKRELIGVQGSVEKEGCIGG